MRKGIMQGVSKMIQKIFTDSDDSKDLYASLIDQYAILEKDSSDPIVRRYFEYRSKSNYTVTF